MIQKFSGYIESKTGVYVYPRFIISIIALTLAILIFGIVFFTARFYRESVKTVGPDAGVSSTEYEARMRAGLRFQPGAAEVSP